MIADAGEHIGDLSLRARRVTNAIRGQQREFQTPRNFDDRMIARFLCAIEMTLQLGINILTTKDFNQLFCGSFCFSVSSVVQSFRNRSIVITSQANQSFCIFSQFIRRHRAFPRLYMLRHAQLHQGDQPAEILIARAITDEKRKRDYRIWDL